MSETPSEPADFDPADFAAALLDAERAPPQDILNDSLDAGGISRDERFAIYRNNVVQGLVAALETRFPAVRRVVGEDFFAAAARLYATATPPSSPFMAFYGESFADFLADFAPCAELPYLPDLARLEAARTRAYHAADAAPLSAEDFRGLAPEDLMRLRLGLHPSVSILASAFPVATIFAMNSGEAPLEEITDWRGEDVVVARPAMNVEVHRLPEGGANFLNRLGEGASLAEAAARALDLTSDFDLAANLALLIRAGLASKMIFPHERTAA